MPEELTPAMYGQKVRIVGGTLENYEGCLLADGIEISPEYIQLL